MNNEQQIQRLNNVHYHLVDRCLHCFHSQTCDKNESLAWINSPDKTKIYCRHHCAWVATHGICDLYRMDASLYGLKGEQEVKHE